MAKMLANSLTGMAYKLYNGRATWDYLAVKSYRGLAFHPLTVSKNGGMR
jgi:hypothetical protein